MKNRVFALCLATILFVVGLCGCSSSKNAPVSHAPEISETEISKISDDLDLEVHFIDVGQADAALLISDGHYMLIDGGNVDDSNLIYSYLNKHDVTYLDYMIGTHAHEDHMGGLSGALQIADVGTVYTPQKESDAKFYQSFKTALSDKDIPVVNPTSGTVLELGDCDVQLLCPEDGDIDDTNNTSIMAKVVCGDTSFLFTGDAEREEEQDILNQGYDLSATVLKAGHHGSDTSSSYPFLREIMPQYVVISVGKDNTYGHPDEDALSRFRDVGAKVYRTDMQGDIVFKSDGSELTVTTGRNSEIETNPTVSSESGTEAQYIGNKSSKKFHRPSCQFLPVDENRVEFDTRNEAIDAGYVGCKSCKP